VLMQLLQIMNYLNRFALQMADTETKMNSIERIEGMRTGWDSIYIYIEREREEERERVVWCNSYLLGFTEFVTLPQEPPMKTSVRPPTNWPELGKVEFENASMRYRPGLPLVVKDLTLTINGGEKVGVVGRTGSGKSSMMLLLFRIVELAEGSLKIDDVNVGDIGLADLRKKLAIIPQEPFLFSGTTCNVEHR